MLSTISVTPFTMASTEIATRERGRAKTDAVNSGVPPSSTFVTQSDSNQFAIPSAISQHKPDFAETAPSSTASRPGYAHYPLASDNPLQQQHYFHQQLSAATPSDQFPIPTSEAHSGNPDHASTTTTAAQQPEPMSCRGCRQPIWDKFLVKVGGGSNSHLAGGGPGRHFYHHHRAALFMSSSLTTPGSISSFPPHNIAGNSFVSQQQQAFEKHVHWPPGLLPPPPPPFGHNKKLRTHAGRKLFLQSGARMPLTADRTFLQQQGLRSDYDDPEFDYDEDDDDDDDGDEEDNLLTPATPVWHEECMKCVVCRNKLEHICYLHDAKIYCREDYLRLFGIKCSVCNRIINRQELVMRVLGNIYHIQCFVCTICGQPLRKGDHFMIRSGQLICKADLEREASLLALAAQGMTPANMASGSSGNENASSTTFSGAEKAESEGGETQPPSTTTAGSSSFSGFQQRHHLLTSSSSHLDGESSATTFLGLATTAANGALGPSTHTLLNCLGSMGNMALAAQRRGPKRPRTILTSQQRRAFKKSFETSAKPCRKVREQLAKELGLNVRVVQVWFQNQRAKIKKIQRKQQLQQQNPNANGTTAGAKNRKLHNNTKKQSSQNSTKSDQDSSSNTKDGHHHAANNNKSSKTSICSRATGSGVSHARRSDQQSLSKGTHKKVGEHSSSPTWSAATTPTFSSPRASSSPATSSPAASSSAETPPTRTAGNAQVVEEQQKRADNFAIPMAPALNYHFSNQAPLTDSQQSQLQFYALPSNNNDTTRSQVPQQQNMPLFFAPNHQQQNFVFTASNTDSNNVMLSSQAFGGSYLHHQTDVFNAAADAAASSSTIFANDDGHNDTNARRPYRSELIAVPENSSNFMAQHYTTQQTVVPATSNDIVQPMVQLNNMCNNSLSTAYF